MSKWSGKYIIGLTGNIATGKSVVRRMLEHLGAYSIDADSLAHRAIAKGAPGYQPIIDLFGKWILGSDGEIDRSKLAGLVFRDAKALEQLENIVHPLVGQAADIFIRRASQRVVVIEAIKLLESEMKTYCNAIWVTYAPENVQVERLVRKRGMTREQAQERVHAQSPQNEKVAAAGVVIRNTGSYDDLWKQVTEAWKQVSPVTDTLPIIHKESSGDLMVQRGRPRDSQAIAELITRLSKGQHKMTAENVMEAFGDKAYLMLNAGGRLVGLAGWQVENLVARTTDLFLDASVDSAAALEALINEMERASHELQSEASLIFPSSELAANEALWKKLGYEIRTPQTLGIQAWQDAATEYKTEGAALYFKQLRQDRVLRPI
ncbi:MAG: dephospho-CoA kinase [Anaerolineaceae bacterium]|nr:MAG: dephospho-CoA kinase [Anaerolineaceae bacterium]